MRFVLRRPWVRAVIAVGLVVALFIGGYGMYLAGEAGRLPWQADPTRISTSLTPFAAIPGFSAPTAVPASPTPGAGAAGGGTGVGS